MKNDDRERAIVKKFIEETVNDKMDWEDDWEQPDWYQACGLSVQLELSWSGWCLSISAHDKEGNFAWIHIITNPIVERHGFLNLRCRVLDDTGTTSRLAREVRASIERKKSYARQATIERILAKGEAQHL